MPERHATGDGWFRHDVAVRFRDIDAMGHAHHTLPLVYLEEARAAFWRLLTADAGLPAIDYVLAEVTVRFHARITYPANLTVQLAVQAVGTKSFTTVFEVRDAGGALLSSGSAVQVAFDYAAGAARPLDAERARQLEQWRAAYEKNRAMVADTTPMKPPST